MWQAENDPHPRSGFLGETSVVLESRKVTKRYSWSDAAESGNEARQSQGVRGGHGKNKRINVLTTKRKYLVDIRDDAIGHQLFVFFPVLTIPSFARQQGDTKRMQNPLFLASLIITDLSVGK